MRLGLLTLALALATPVWAQTHLVVVTGLAGESAFGAAFHESAITLLDAARDRLGIPEDRLLYLADRPPGDAHRVTAPATRAEVTRVLQELARQAAPEALVVIVLIGHGSARGGTHQINLRGPDLTAEDLQESLTAFPTQHVAVVNAASASGGWIGALSGPRRTIITATRSAVEREQSHFHRYFARAFATDAADTDKNHRVSLLEAFRFATREVERFYESDNRLRTEHALLDDNGDGSGSLEPGGLQQDGAVAAALYLDAAGPAATSDPHLADLMARRDSLERALAALRARQDAMTPARYERDLEALLLEIARVGRAIREREGTE